MLGYFWLFFGILFAFIADKQWKNYKSGARGISSIVLFIVFMSSACFFAYLFLVERGAL